MIDRCACGWLFAGRGRILRGLEVGAKRRREGFRAFDC
jgi:hypothetical protein